MAHPLYVAFVWHQHQPLYKSRLSGEYRLPWVRLHGTKDYLDLMLLLERYPKLHQTVNLVPSLIMQLEDYAAGTAFDPYLSLLLKPTADLTLSDRQFAIEHFFDANHHTLIDPHPRYRELYSQRQEQGADWCLENWTASDYSDLLAWHNLAWIDPLFWDDAEIATWLRQGRGFSLSDRQRIYSKQRQIISRIIPQHRHLQNLGQIEVTTSPYSHPILPLLMDTNSAKVAIPDVNLPQLRFQAPEDVPRQLAKAKQIYADRFGRLPRGLWPSEQSVSPAILEPIAAAGFEWICADEAVLGWTVQQFLQRDRLGLVEEPELLYRPYRLETAAGNVSIVFRDHRLSDLIGFTYSNVSPTAAAKDLIAHLDTIATALKSHQSSGSTALENPWLVTIALDGENCWEAYEQDGKLFLEALYARLSQRSDLQLVTVSEFLDRFPPRLALPAAKLHSGSWVDGSFSTWIGDPAKNRAWDLLTAARQTLARHPEATEENNPEVWEALDAAAGSDWFWWFGEGHSSSHDAMFDQLFREHLAALYQSLNEPIPVEIRSPVELHLDRPAHRPEGFIHPIITGSGDPQDWDKAGRIEIGGAAGTMHRSSLIQRLWYGVDHRHFYLRLDWKRGAQWELSLPPELHLLWFYPHQALPNAPAPLAELPDEPPLNYLFHHHLGIHLPSRSTWLQAAGVNCQWLMRPSHAQVAIETCLEIAIPWQDLQAIEPDWSLRLVVVQAEEGRYVDYLPENALIPVDVP